MLLQELSELIQDLFEKFVSQSITKEKYLLLKEEAFAEYEKKFKELQHLTSPEQRQKLSDEFQEKLTQIHDSVSSEGEELQAPRTREYKKK